MSPASPAPAWKGRATAMAVRVVALLVAFSLGAFFVGGDSTPAPADHAEHVGQTWTCSMHPQIQQGQPGQCPLCGMDLIPVSSGAPASNQTVVLSERARALSRLRTEVVRRQSEGGAEVRLLGRIEPNETTRKNVTTWIGGRIDRLHVNVTGERVRRGATIATLYSPEVYGAHQDLIAARNQVERLSGSSDASRKLAQAALDAARERLQLLGVPESELTTMQAADVPTRAVAIRSPFSGTVIERVATEGAYVDTGAVLYRLANLSTLWVQLDAYESDLPMLSVGQSVSLRVEGLGSGDFEGRIAFIDPTVDPQRRTARVRVEVDNPDGLMRPGMFAEATVTAGGEIGEDAPLVIPATAPLFTGKRSLVYIELETQDQLTYAPRTVRLGPRLGDVYPVVAGLTEGERVVTRGAFALDADLQIRGGPSMMSAEDDRTPPAPVPARLPAADSAQLVPVLEHYLGVQRALAEDDLPATQDAATKLKNDVTAVTLKSPVPSQWPPLAKALSSHAGHITMATDLEGARGAFEPLSLAAERMLQQLGNPLSTPVKVAFCPMALGSNGARWVQQGDKIDNAYFGASMRDCGEIEATVGPGAHLLAPANP